MADHKVLFDSSNTKKSPQQTQAAHNQPQVPDQVAEPTSEQQVTPHQQTAPGQQTQAAHHQPQPAHHQPQPHHQSPPQPQQAQPQQAHPHQAQEPSQAQNPVGPVHRLHRYVDDYSTVMREESPSTKWVTSFAPKPLNTALSVQQADEHIILLLRQHPITQLKWVLSAVGLALVPILFISIGLLDFLSGPYQLAAWILWYLLLTGFVIESFLKWFFHVYIITDERVMDVDFLSLVYKNISTTKIGNIQDSTAKTVGFVASLFDYGTVYIQTAAQQREFQFENVPHPSRVKKLLNELIMEKAREKRAGGGGV